MSVLKWLLGDVTLNVGGEQIGHLFNSSLFNISTSAVGTSFSGINCVKATAKAIVSPSPLCRALYGASAGLNGISCISSSLCLLSSYSAIAPVPVFFGSLGYVTSYAGRICNTAGDCINPASGATSKAIQITNGF
jgi:hypothetical protein